MSEREIFGEDDPDNKESLDEEQPEEETELIIHLPKDATFTDLYQTMDQMVESANKDGLAEDPLAVEDLFVSELWDNFSDELADRVLEFRNQPEQARVTKVLDFFTQHGWSQEDVEVFLPLKFV